MSHEQAIPRRRSSSGERTPARPRCRLFSAASGASSAGGRSTAPPPAGLRARARGRRRAGRARSARSARRSAPSRACPTRQGTVALAMVAEKASALNSHAGVTGTEDALPLQSLMQTNLWDGTLFATRWVTFQSPPIQPSSSNIVTTQAQR